MISNFRLGITKFGVIDRKDQTIALRITTTPQRPKNYFWKSLHAICCLEQDGSELLL